MSSEIGNSSSLERTGESWSGRPDLNRGPLAPKASALPGCATPRNGRQFHFAKLLSGCPVRITTAEAAAALRAPEAKCAEVQSGVSRTDLPLWCMILPAPEGEAIVLADSFEKEERNGSKEDPDVGWGLR